MFIMSPHSFIRVRAVSKSGATKQSAFICQRDGEQQRLCTFSKMIASEHCAVPLSIIIFHRFNTFPLRFLIHKSPYSVARFGGIRWPSSKYTVTLWSKGHIVRDPPRFVLRRQYLNRTPRRIIKCGRNLFGDQFGSIPLFCILEHLHSLNVLQNRHKTGSAKYDSTAQRT